MDWLLICFTQLRITVLISLPKSTLSSFSLLFFLFLITTLSIYTRYWIFLSNIHPNNHEIHACTLFFVVVFWMIFNHHVSYHTFITSSLVKSILTRIRFSSRFKTISALRWHSTSFIMRIKGRVIYLSIQNWESVVEPGNGKASEVSTLSLCVYVVWMRYL